MKRFFAAHRIQITLLLTVSVLTLSQCSKTTESASTLPALTNVTAIVAAGYHACALLTDGSMRCWGSNTKGEIGMSSGGTCERGSSQEACETVARQVTGLTSGVTAMAIGSKHTCAIVSGVVKCWGNNSNGQVGNNTTTNASQPTSVTSALIGTAVTAIGAGDLHSCSVNGSGAAHCWGDNTNGGLGNGSTTQSLIPVAVTGLGSGVSAIGGGNAFTCARLTDSSAQCWGAGTYGQLGNNATSDSSTPVQVNGLTAGVTNLASAYSLTFGFNCAKVFNGIQCWGKNAYGNLGDDSQTDSSVPVNVSSIVSGVTSLALGANHACAVVNSGVKCWGSNASGVLGTTTGNLTVLGSAAAASKVPVDVQGLSGTPTAVAAGTDFTCALLQDKTVQCWGANSYGSLGNGSAQSSTTPVTVLKDS